MKTITPNVDCAKPEQDRLAIEVIKSNIGRSSRKRSVVKAITYRIVIICLDFLVLYLLTGKSSVALSFMIVSNLYTTACYFLHERVWEHIMWGRIAA